MLGRREHLLRDDDRKVLRRAGDLALHPRDLLRGRRRVRDELAVPRERLRLRGLLFLVLRDGLLVDPVERLPGRAVEEVQPARLPGRADPLHRVAVVLDVEQDRRSRRVVVPDVVVDLLEAPFDLPGVLVDRDDRRRVEVVALAVAAEPVVAGIARRDVEEVQVLVVRGGRPDRGAAAQVRRGVLRPGLAPGLARAGNHVGAPDAVARFGVDRLQEPARAVVRADDADVDLPVEEERGAGDHLALLPLDELAGPERAAGIRVECDDLAVELAEVEAAVADRDASVQPAAADRGDLLADVRLVLPEDLPAVDRDGEHVVVAGRDVDDAVLDDRLALARVLRGNAGAVEVRPPDALELSHVRGVDVVERRVALVRHRRRRSSTSRSRRPSSAPLPPPEPQPATIPPTTVGCTRDRPGRTHHETLTRRASRPLSDDEIEAILNPSLRRARRNREGMSAELLVRLLGP